ncbi:MAG: CopG family antitoxin [Candidatus Dormibacteraceae bacterium]
MITNTELKEFHEDPYDQMSQEEFEEEMVCSLRPVSTPISIRIPAGLLNRTKREAERRGVRYQTLINRLIATGVDRLEQAGV